MWNCQCDCGEVTVVYAHNLHAKPTHSCGCTAPNRMHREVDLTGRVFGSLTVKRRHDRGHAKWVCVCQCGIEAIAGAGDLLRWKKSCGCLQKRHDMARTLIYQIWGAMIQRCCNPRSKAFLHYGGRGIQVCDRWREFESFFADMGHRPDGMSLDRIDNNGPYSPENCRWASRMEQASNKRSNRWITVNEERLTIAQAGRKFGISRSVAESRLRAGWTVEETFSTPILPHGRRRGYATT